MERAEELFEKVKKQGEKAIDELLILVKQKNYFSTSNGHQIMEVEADCMTKIETTLRKLFPVLVIPKGE